MIIKVFIALFYKDFYYKMKKGYYMISKKEAIEKYKNMSYIRCDDDGTAYFFTCKDFPGLKQENYSFTSSLGHKLQGYLYSYDNAIKNRVIVFDHGFGAGHTAYMKEIEKLCKNGFLVLSYDHTGCMESGGINANGMSQSLHDLDDCIKTIKKDGRFQNYDVSVIGHSWGGFSALNITALHKNIEKVVVLSGFVSVELLIESYFGKELAKHLIELETKTNPDYVNFNGVESLKSSGAKALLIYSDNDHLCYKNASYDILYEVFKDDSNVKLILENGKWHNPNYTMDAVEYYLSFATLKAELLSKNLLLTKEQKEAFKASFDWNRMTAQDEKIWNEIINWLK